jgi:hypothetical protein
MRIIRISALPMATLLLWHVTARPVRGQEQVPFRIQVADYPRPISEAVRQIEKHFGRVVTYEDIRYVHAADIVDVTARVRRDGDMSKRVLAMRSGSIDVTYSAPPGTSVERQVEEVLETVIAQSRAAGNTGDFRVERTSGAYHVVPVAMKGKSGVMEPYVSPLDTRITLPRREERAAEMMGRVSQAITSRSRVTVTEGVFPINLFMQRRVDVGAEDERARDVLWRALQSMNADLSWQLLCEAGDSATCALNIHGVPGIGRWKREAGR